MRNYFLTAVMLVPLLVTLCYAAQNTGGDPSFQPYVFSDDSGGDSYLGVDIADITTERMSALKLKEEKGAEITMVDQDAPAGKAGIKEHDVILTLNGDTVESAAQLRRMIHETPPGRIVTLGVSRDGQPLTIKVQLADKSKEYGNMGPNSKGFYFQMPKITIPEIDIPAITVVTTSSMRSGLTVENITPQLGEFFGVKNGNGILVRSVEKGSRADKAGFRAGDVIVRVNDQQVHDTSDFSHAVRSRSGNSVNVSVIRDKKEQNLNLELPEHHQSDSMFFNEESTNGDAITAETDQELSALRDEMAKLRPEMDLASENARRAAEEMRKSIRDQAEKMRERSAEQRKLLRHEQEKLRQDMRHMQIEIQRSWADI
jgi:serine protease Do